MKKIPKKVKVIIAFSLILFAFGFISIGLNYKTSFLINRINYKGDDIPMDVNWKEDTTYKIRDISSEITKVLEVNKTTEDSTMGISMKGGTIVGDDQYVVFAETFPNDSGEKTYLHVHKINNDKTINSSPVDGVIKTYDFEHGNDMTYNPNDGYVYVISGKLATDPYKIGRFKLDQNGRIISETVDTSYKNNIQMKYRTHTTPSSKTIKNNGDAGISYNPDEEGFIISQGDFTYDYDTDFNYTDTWNGISSYMTGTGINYRNGMMYIIRYEAGEETEQQNEVYNSLEAHSNLIHLFQKKHRNCEIRWHEERNYAYSDCAHMLRSFYISKDTVDGKLQFVSFFNDGKMLLGYDVGDKLVLYKTTFSLNDPESVTVSRIEPYEYAIGYGTLNYNNINIKVVYEDKTEEEMTLTEAQQKGTVTVSGFDNTTLGDKRVTITYKPNNGTKSASGTCNVVVVRRNPSTVVVKKLPNKLNYIKGENLDLTGGVLEVYYNDDTMEEHSMTENAVTVSDYDKNTVGEQTIKIRYSVSKTTTFIVNVEEELSSISVKTNPTKMTYIKGEDLDLTGGKLNLNYSDSTISELDMDANGVTVSGYNKNTVGEQTVTVSYKEKTTTFNVTVTEPTLNEILIKTNPDKTAYNKGENLDLTGGVLTLKYSNNTSSELSMDANGVTVSGYNKNTVGEQTLTVSYKEKTAQFTVTVSESAQEDLELNVSYNEQDTYTEVTIETTSNVDLKSITGWTLSNDKKSLSKKYSDSAQATVLNVCDTRNICSNVSIKELTLKKQNMAFNELNVIKEITEDNYTQTVNVDEHITVTYASSDDSIASVNNSGKVTFNKAGTVTITATSNKNSVYYKGVTNYTLTITKASQTISFENTTINKKVTDSTYKIEAVHTKGDGVVTYTSSDPTVATVDNNGQVTIIKKGSTTIVATAGATDRYLAISASYTLNVSDRTQEISFDQSSVIKKLSDDSYVMKVKRVEGDGNITYSSSNTNVATVDDNGLVTIKTIGETIITATAGATDEYDETSTSYILNVEKGEQQISFDDDIKDEMVVTPTREPFKLKALLKIGNGTLSYQSSDPTVATIDNEGLVTVVGEGTTTITVSVEGTDEYMPTTKTIQLRVGDKKEDEIIVPDTGKNIPLIVFIVSTISIGIGFIMINKTNKSNIMNK